MSKNGLTFILLLLTGMLTPSACSDDNAQNQSFIPNVPVNITINTDLPLHFHLKNLGAYTYLEGGSKGVFLVHNFDDQFYALERTCSFEPDRACSKLFVDSLNFQMQCGNYEDGKWKECCSSKFSFDGFVQESPAQFPLRTYAVQLNGSIINIRN